VLDGERVPVRWTDGDGFRVEGGRLRGVAARLAGVNALEIYGPVHRFARAAPEDLLALARQSAGIAASGERRCASGKRDRYGRLLVDCPDAARELVRRGHAMVFAVDRPADPDLLEAQRAAQAAGAGMWAWGVPRAIVTSAHSAADGGYDRLVDPHTGRSEVRRHGRSHEPCAWVCAPGDGEPPSCLLHVPYTRRYRDRPACLRGKP
jgi:endonuclease YncB( thermonuclease family)